MCHLRRSWGRLALVRFHMRMSEAGGGDSEWELLSNFNERQSLVVNSSRDRKSPASILNAATTGEKHHHQFPLTCVHALPPRCAPNTNEHSTQTQSEYDQNVERNEIDTRHILKCSTHKLLTPIKHFKMALNFGAPIWWNTSSQHTSP